jgi:hypothetical protein
MYKVIWDIWDINDPEMYCVICGNVCDRSGLCYKHKYDEQLAETD